MKKAEEKPKVMGVSPVFMFVGVILILITIVVIFIGGLHLIKTLAVLGIDVIAVILIKSNSIDKREMKMKQKGSTKKKMIIKGK